MNKAVKVKLADIRAHKNREQPLVCLTAYTAPMARLLDPHCDILLVGDSVGMVVYGMENTLGVNITMMIAHGKAVMRQAKQACVVVDMPYGSYEASPDQALQNAWHVMDETGCAGVKLEGGQEMEETIALLVKNDIPVMAHIGLLPQSVEKDGGYKIKGKTAAQEKQLLADAKAVESAGAFSVVIEGTIDTVAEKITRAVSIPTIGIGASPACDGQILVTEDLLGLGGYLPKFAKVYADLAPVIDGAASAFAADVRARRFPDADHVYKAKASL